MVRSRGDTHAEQPRERGGDEALTHNGFRVERLRCGSPQAHARVRGEDRHHVGENQASVGERQSVSQPDPAAYSVPICAPELTAHRSAVKEILAELDRKLRERETAAPKTARFL